MILKSLNNIFSSYIFLFLFFLKNDGISKSFCDEVTSELDGIELIFFSHVFDTMLSTPILEIGSFFANPVARIYISEQGELFNMVVFSSVMTGLYAPINGLVRSRISYLNAVKKTRNMQIMTFLSSIVYTIISAFTLGKLFGAYGVLASDLMRVVLLMLTVWIYYAIVTKKLFPSPDDYLALPDIFDLNPGDVISLDIRDAEDVSLVAEQIQLFAGDIR